MSHYVTIKAKVSDIALFKEVLKEHGVVWDEGESNYHVARYEGLNIYFTTDHEGAIVGYDSVGLSSLVQVMERATEDYLIRKVEQDALLNGFSVARRERLEDGTVEIVLEDLA